MPQSKTVLAMLSAVGVLTTAATASADDKHLRVGQVAFHAVDHATLHPLNNEVQVRGAALGHGVRIDVTDTLRGGRLTSFTQGIRHHDKGPHGFDLDMGGLGRVKLTCNAHALKVDLSLAGASKFTVHITENGKVTKNESHVPGSFELPGFDNVHDGREEIVHLGVSHAGAWSFTLKHDDKILVVTAEDARGAVAVPHDFVVSTSGLDSFSLIPPVVAANLPSTSLLVFGGMRVTSQGGTRLSSSVHRAGTVEVTASDERTSATSITLDCPSNPRWPIETLSFRSWSVNGDRDLWELDLGPLGTLSFQLYPDNTRVAPVFLRASGALHRTYSLQVITEPHLTRAFPSFGPEQWVGPLGSVSDELIVTVGYTRPDPRHHQVAKWSVAIARGNKTIVMTLDAIQGEVEVTPAQMNLHRLGVRNRGGYVLKQAECFAPSP